MYAVILVQKTFEYPSEPDTKITQGWFEIASEDHVNIEDAKAWIWTRPSEDQDKYRIIRFY